MQAIQRSQVETTDGLSEPVLDKPTPSNEMEQKQQLSGINITTIALTVLSLILGIVGGLLASVASNAEWKGKMEQRMETLERQRVEDKQAWDYIRTQNEVNGKSLVRIEAALDVQKDRRR